MNNRTHRNVVLISGGAGYIGSHVAHALERRGFSTLVLDSLVSGHGWAVQSPSIFRRGDIADAALVRELCATYRPVAALHFAAFIEVGESVSNPEKYFTNNRDKAKAFFDVLASEGVDKIVFSSTAAVYGEVRGEEPITEDRPTAPVNPYGQSKLDAENYLRGIPAMRSATLRYFNVAGASPDAGLGEAHFPESHLIPRLALQLAGISQDVRDALGLTQGFKIYGDDYATRDGTAVRDFLHILDLADAHVKALDYLLKGGGTEIFNLGSGAGYSVREIVQAARDALARPDFDPEIGPRRPGDPGTLVASSEKAKRILGWKPTRDISEMIRTAAAWHRSEAYRSAILAKARN